jgi:esterase/lipase superfamily enzyme
MARECPICGEEPTEKITATREAFPDPTRTELEIHVKRNHSMDEMRKHLNKGKRKDTEVTAGLEFADVDKVVGEILDGSKSEDNDTKSSKSKKSRAGRPTKSTKRGTVVKESKPSVRLSPSDSVEDTLEAKGVPKTALFK